MSGIKNSLKNSWLEILSVKNPLNRKEYNEALAHVRQNFMEFYRHDLFLRLELEPFCDILNSDDLNVENEEVVFDSVRLWLSFNNLDPNIHLKPLLSVVRFSLLSTKYLLDEVEPFVNPIPNCRYIFFDLLRHHFGDKKINESFRKFHKISPENNEKYHNSEITPKYMKPGLKLLSIGSDNLKTANVIEIFDNNLNQWIKPNRLAIYRKNYSTAFIDGKVMLIGGTQSLDKNNEPLNMVQSLDLSSGILTTEASLNDNRQYATAVVVGKGKSSFIFVLGGQGKEKDLDSVERWDPLSWVWTRIPPMLKRRTGLAAAVLDDKIYVLGGRIDSDYTNTMEAYNLDSGKWEIKDSMKEARAHFCVTAFKGCLYAVAGSKGYLLRINTVEKYNPDHDFWLTLANVMATGTVGISSLANRLICAGGSGSKSVLEYDDKNDKWSKLSDLHVPRAGHLLELPSKINDFEFNWDDQTMSSQLLFMGNQKSNAVCVLEVYDVRYNQWTRLNDLNMEKINYSVAHIDDNLLLIGGRIDDINSELPTVHSLNLRTGNVTLIAPLNDCRQHSAAVVVKQGKFKFVYIFGGTRNGNHLKSVERWDSSSRVWVYMTPMTVARTGHGVVLLEDEIYVIGGKTENSHNRTVEAYDFENDCWIPKASMNNTNAYFGVTTYKNCIYVAGGNKNYETPVNTVERYDPIQNVWFNIANIFSTGVVGISGLGNKLICAGGISSNIAEEYDETNNRWQKLSPLGNQSSGFLIEMRPDIKIYSSDWIIDKRLNNKLVFLGDLFSSKSNIIETFDVIEKKWTRLKDLPFTKSTYKVNIIDNKLLLIGGIDGKIFLNTLDAIDLSHGTIESLSPLKIARVNSASVVVQEGDKNILYVLGGRDENWKILASVEKWDSSTNKWTDGIPLTSERYQIGSVFLNGKIYVVGGHSGSSYLNTVEAFDIKSGIWESKASMNNRKGYFGIAIFKEHIYIAGGFSNYGLLSTVECYDPLTNSWRILANIESCYRVGLCSIGDRLICAGGDKNSVQEYNAEKNEWISLPSKNEAYHRGYLLKLPEGAKLGNW